MSAARRALAGALLAAMTIGAAPSPLDPTTGADPATFDAQWSAAEHKHDPARKALLARVGATIRTGPFRADYESLDTYRIPQWYKDAKFGIFIHWGVYAVPGYGNTWYPRQMYVPGTDIFKHHLETYGPQDRFGYKDFIPLFRAEHFDPQAWAHLFKLAGARYVIPVFEHHDGFAMYDSDLSDWTVAKMGPKRDTGGELAAAIRAEGMHFGASSHRIEHDFFFGGGRTIRSDVNDPHYASLYGPAHAFLEADSDDAVYGDFTTVAPAFIDDWLARSAEIVEKYHPEIMYFDWWDGQPAMRGALTRFAAFYYDASLKFGDHVGVINYKYHAMRPQSAVLDIERGQLADGRDLHWQTDTSVSSKSWGYLKDDRFKSPDFIVRQLVDIVSKNGNLLLNVGPRPDGTIPDEVQGILLAVGGWLAANGAAIYDTTPWILWGEGPNKATGGAFNDTKADTWSAEDFRFTRGKDAIYAIEMAWPAGGEAVIRSLGRDCGFGIAAVDLLGAPGALAFRQEADGLHITLPAHPPGPFAYAYRIRTALAR